ncbi:unnamed protein product [marine sediment metagenome]|uniref:Uncharacterized protein n=1 Tax=marine sediment metagenome TaxID=412755 RepID=X1AVK4_9ZZZZ
MGAKLTTLTKSNIKANFKEENEVLDIKVEKIEDEPEGKD